MIRNNQVDIKLTLIFKEIVNLYNSFEAFEAQIYSALIEDWATLVWHFENHKNGHLPKIAT